MKIIYNKLLIKNSFFNYPIACFFILIMTFILLILSLIILNLIIFLIFNTFFFVLIVFLIVFFFITFIILIVYIFPLLRSSASFSLELLAPLPFSLSFPLFLSLSSYSSPLYSLHYCYYHFRFHYYHF